MKLTLISFTLTFCLFQCMEAHAAWVPNGPKCPSAFPIKTVLQADGSCVAYTFADRAYTHVKPAKCYATMEDALASGCVPFKK